MKLRSLLAVAILLVTFSSCGIDDLEDRLNEVENALGTNEPLSIEFQTTNNDDQEIIEKTSYRFKAKGLYNNYIEDYQDGNYYVYIERFSDVGWNEGATISFYYNSATGEVTDATAHVYFYDQFENWIDPYFSPEYTGNTFNFNLKSINVETGAVNIEVDAASDETGTYNEYEGKPMTCTFEFKGKLDIYID